MDNLSPGQAANFLKIPPSTLRLWSRQFARHLSADATPEEGRRRSYTADDLKVLTRAAELLRLGKTVEEADRLLGVTPEPADLTGLEVVTVADLNAALIDARDVIGRLAEELKATRDRADQARADAAAATTIAQEARQEADAAKAQAASLEAGLQSLRDEDLQAVKNAVNDAREKATRRAESLKAEAQTDRDRLTALEERLKAYESATWLDRLLGRRPKPPASE